jgi:hypothetical protein
MSTPRTDKFQSELGAILWGGNESASVISQVTRQIAACCEFARELERELQVEHGDTVPVGRPGSFDQLTAPPRGRSTSAKPKPKPKGGRR